MSRRTRWFIALLSVVLLVAGVSVSSAAEQSCVLVIPSRYALVQFAYDITRIRPVALIAYDDQSEADTPYMHVWDDTADDWVQISLEDYGAADFAGATTNLLILVGEDGSLPKSILEASSWANTAERINSLSLVKLAAVLDKTMKFKRKEWEWIGRRHGIKVKDVNAERRRYGRFGKPGENKIDEIEDADLPVPDELVEPEDVKIDEANEKDPDAGIITEEEDDQETGIDTNTIDEEMSPEDK